MPIVKALLLRCLRLDLLITGGWEASYAASNRAGILTCEDRQELCIGICHVLASLPDNQRSKSLLALAMPSLDCICCVFRVRVNRFTVSIVFCKMGRLSTLDSMPFRYVVLAN